MVYHNVKETFIKIELNALYKNAHSVHNKSEENLIRQSWEDKMASTIGKQ